MKRKTFGRMNCSIARALELVGEWWTMLILREAFLGTRRFQDFQRHLGIARNILSARLKKLVTRGVLERAAAPGGGRRLEYHLTEKGRAFFPVLMALMQWGDRFAACAGGPPVKVVERVSGTPIADIRVFSREGRPLAGADVRIVPGPGAGALTRARFKRTQPARQSEAVSASADPGIRDESEPV